ncbi:hemoglobin [Seinonella peptonophila]|uniref:Hemoglobin n=1 Tax=Seinonella peptonophila TaxID=112248 RepID=A0A1M5BH42_9BACL|nr:hypothetical protein [Seinonella peptonophila]SHF41923.1 hemoglobin [Seinonella peptonophila]
MNKGISLYEQMGGESKLRELVNIFYNKVKVHHSLSHLFPEDFKPDKQFLFLTEFLGGPAIYSEAFGQKKLKSKHLHFPVTKESADAWLDCMRESMDEVNLHGAIRKEIWSKLEITAYQMINQPE